MKWSTVRDIAWFVFIWITAIKLIEYQGDDWWLNLAGDFFGAMGLMFIAMERALRDDE